MSLLFNKGNGTFAAASPFDVGNSPRAITAHDLNADGKPELIIHKQSFNPQPDVVKVYLNKGNGAFSFDASYDVGETSPPSSIAVGDIDGDGKPDLAVTDSNVVNLLVNEGAAKLAAPVGYPAGSWPLAVGAADFNGAGRLDLVTANDHAAVTVLLNGCLP